MKNLLKLIGALLMLGASSSAYAWVALAIPANIPADQPKVYAIASNGADRQDAITRAIAACAAANSGNHGCAVDKAGNGDDAVFDTCIAVVPFRDLNARNDRRYSRAWASRDTESAAIADAERFAQSREKAGSAVAACSTPGESPTTTTANHQSVLLASSDCSSSETFTNGQCRGSGSWVAIAHRPTYYTDPNAIIVAGYGATEQEARSRAIAACNQEVSQSDCVIRGDDTTPPFPMTGQGCYATIPLRVSVSAGIQYWLPFSIRPTCEAASTAARQGVEANRNDPAVSVLHQGAVITRDSAAAGSATSQPINLASLAPGSGGGGGGGGSGGAAIAIGAVAVVGLAAWAFSGTSDEPVETSFAPVAFYEVNDGVRHWNVGTRFNWSQGDWTAYWTATKTSANDRSFLYGTGMNWTGDIFAAKFNSRGIADEARMDFALSADKQFGLWKFSPNYRLDYAKTEADETLRHALTADAVWKSDKWTVRHSVGFHGNSFAAFADKATAKIQLRRDF